MFTYRITDDNSVYYSQRNNADDPNGSCNVTAITEALALVGMDVDSAEKAQGAANGEQVEDFLADMTKTKELRDLMIKNGITDPAAVPREQHFVLERVCNEFAGYDADKYNEYTPIAKILHHVGIRRFPAVISTFLAGTGHVVTLVGFDSTQDLTGVTEASQIDLSQVQAVWLMDPWGDWTKVGPSGKHYRLSDDSPATKGKNVRIDYKQFFPLWKTVWRDQNTGALNDPQGQFSKRAHLIIPKGAEHLA